MFFFKENLPVDWPDSNLKAVARVSRLHIKQYRQNKAPRTLKVLRIYLKTWPLPILIR